MIPGRAAAVAMRPERNMKGKQVGPPSNIARLRESRLGAADSASILDGLQMISIFLKIESEGDRKKVLDLAKQLAPVDADAGT
jgi:hypothetical protein